MQCFVGRGGCERLGILLIGINLKHVSNPDEKICMFMLLLVSITFYEHVRQKLTSYYIASTVKSCLLSSQKITVLPQNSSPSHVRLID